MIIEQIKESLLSAGIVEDNEFLDNYAQLILDNRDTDKIKFCTQIHHILPRSYFKQNKLDIDDTEDNKVNLLFKDHILAHYYLANCGVGDFKYSNQVALFQMLGRKREDQIDITTINLDILQQLYEDFCRKDSELNSGEHNGNYAHYWTDEQKQNLSLKQRQFYIDHPEAKENLRQKQLGVTPGNKGKNAYYNLITNEIIYADTCPDGFQDGMPQYICDKISQSLIGNKFTTGMSWYNNGIENRMFSPADEIPDGFVKCKLISDKEREVYSRKRKYYYDENGSKVAIFDGQDIPLGLTKETPKDVHDRYSKQLSGENNPMFGKHHSDYTKQLISEANKIANAGEKNPSYGKKWYHDGYVRIYIKEECPAGFRPGYKRGEKCLKTWDEIDDYIKEKNYG